ncbi:RHS repeat-associated core domain-containing protein [Catellatospora coxensis]|uniref:RHS repeat-associated protein n=1 Tax=Catellatospora coxensis TaxID=310354 RepID=A0A8J3KZW3_9ACTN|nr:RHS repeat-associated core domain-containing protein [Catellatospora coxensis]GIG08609.1 hypothetical protein Cco03nite_53090 [Catellatospora coxensis]
MAQLPVAALASTDPGRPAAQAQQKAARGSGLTPERAKEDPTAGKVMSRPDAVAWPAAASADIEAASVDATPVSVGGLAVDLSQADRTARGAAQRSADAEPGRARVKVYDRAASRRVGVDGPLVSLQRNDASPSGGKVKLSLGYRGFAHAVGGDWGARLRLVALPSCALTTPEQAQCRVATPLPSRNDSGEATVSADVDLVALSGTSVFALAAADSSTQGDYKATQLSPSSSWETKLSSGAFSWTYPIRSPGTPGGFGPQVALAYSSQTVDGRTSATNNQGSWMGEGFSYEPGYIERRYKACSDDGHDGSTEQCWAFQNGTVMLSGHSGTMVKITDDLWKLSTDDGTRVERKQGATNGDNDGEHWKVTTTDGTQYFFGLGRLPGWTSGKEETDSVWSVPVYGDDSGEPCYKSSGFDDSYCNQGWRWNLDYVVDPRGNVISYFYDSEVNYYARGGKTDVDGTAYHRGGYLARIDYGQRDGQVYTTDAPARVVFETAERCIPAGGVDCDPADLNEDTAASWPDVPQDRICAPNTHCESSQSATTFFTRKRLTKIQTEVRGATNWLPVESWVLEHQFKANDDNSRTLWLSKINHSGHWGGTTQALPPTELDGIQLSNRIVVDGDHMGPLIRYRLATVKTDSGAQITINYKTPDCTKDNLPAAADGSTRRCYPVLWNPLGGGEDDRVTDWFHKYVVDNVVTDDLVGGNDDMVSSYEYVGSAAWRKSAPDGISKADYLTWSDWRGYAQVNVRTGDGQSMPGRVDHYFLRGLSGGELGDGSKPAVTRTDSTGGSYTDHDQLSGHELETIVYDGTAVVSKTINQPWRHVTRTQTETWGSNVAAMVRTDVVRQLTAMPDDAQGNPVWRETKSVTTYDTTWGRPDQVDDLGEVGAGKDGDDKCTRTWYLDNPDPARYLHGYVSRTQTVSVKCTTTPDLSKHLVTDTRTSFDLQAWGAVPTEGTGTRSESLDRYDGTTIRYVIDSETTSLDAYNRPLTVKDARAIAENRTFSNITEYTETYGLTTQVKSTNAANHVTTTTLDPAFGLAVAAVDPNLRRTELAYDSLGQLTAVWTADRNRSQGATPNLKYSYFLRNDKATVVKTEKLANDGTYRASYELHDGLLRLRQTQVPGQGGWLLTDTFHNGLGKAYKTNAAYLATGTAGDTPIVTAEGAVNGQNTLVFDGAGRTVSDTFSVAGDARWVTTTTYEGDRVSVDPPQGGSPTTTVSDARGQATELYQYHGDSPTGPADVTHYTYTPAGLLDTVTDPLGNVWNYDYNQRGLKERAEDPDTGVATYTYNTSGDLLSSSDARPVKLSNKYDVLGRKVEAWQGDVGTGTKLAAWVFDPAGNKGQLHYSQRIDNSQNYYVINMTRDSLYRVTSLRYSFPSGGVGSSLSGNYDFSTAYNTDGTIQSLGMPAGGGLTAEAVASIYDDLQRPTTLTGTSSYVTSALYSNVNELLQTELYTGGTGKKAWLGWDYERGTGRLTKTKVSRQGVATPDMDALYRYDDSGSVLSIEDTPVGGTRDVQCFGYDYLRRLTEAWATDSTTKTCADGVEETGVGGPAPYHQSWTFDKIGNRDVETLHSTTGGADTVRDYTYPASGAGKEQPHAVSRVDEKGPGGDKTFNYAYDKVGNTTCRPNAATGNVCPPNTPAGQQALTWNAEGRLAASTPAGGQATTYVYDADGRRIARKEPGGTTTLFLPNMELKQTGTVVAGTRYYSFGGHTVAVRTGSGVDFQAADHHGTAGCTISAATGAITWRRTTPYGAGRGQAPASWPDQKGFIGGTQDPTGLVNLGAREYDPLLGRFISVDPIMDLTDPQQWSAYSYGNSSPLVVADPSGLLGSASCAPGEVGGPGACTGSENGNGPGDPGTKPDPPLLTIPLAYDGELDWVEYRWLNERYGYIGSAKMTMRDLLDWKAGKRDRRAFYVDDESNFMGEVCDFMGRSGCGFGAQRSMQQGLESWKDLPVAGIAANLLLAVSYTATDDADKALESLIDGVGAVPVGGGVAVGGVEFGLGEVADIAKTVASSAVEGRKGYGFGAVGPASDIWVEKSGLIQIGSEPDSRDQIDAEWTSYRSIAPIPTEWLVAARRSGPETVQSLVGFFVQTGIWEKG